MGMCSGRAGWVDTRPKTLNPLSVQNPKIKKICINIRPYICSWTDGRTNGLDGLVGQVGFGEFLPTLKGCYPNINLRGGVI